MAHQPQLLGVASLLLTLALTGSSTAEPIVYPYLQNLTTESAELYWVDNDPSPVTVTWGKGKAQRTQSESTPAPELAYHPTEENDFPELRADTLRFLHRARLDGLQSSETVPYHVHFPAKPFRTTFRTLPGLNDPVKLIAYADSETEPESTGKAAKWGTDSEPQRRYLVDQTTGYRENLKFIKEQAPSAVLIAGDLVESGGEQRDWDEFWKHNRVLAGSIPILPSPGNHEYWAGPRHGGYSEAGARWAINKYRTYFHPRGESKARHYYEQKIGRVTILSLDSGDGLPHGSQGDTNHYLKAAPDFGVDFQPHSSQGKWLVSRLQKAQAENQFVVVMFHHCPYSSGTHGFAPGSKDDRDEQSGQPMRVLTPLFFQFGVDLVLTGHDEMFEHSTVSGLEVRPDGSTAPHTVHVYDVGVGGDGLRGPKRQNRYKRFLAYQDSPEMWRDGVLHKGGRHYGHLEIDVQPTTDGEWKATIEAVYILPKEKRTGWSFSRCLYPDRLELKSR